MSRSRQARSALAKQIKSPPPLMAAAETADQCDYCLAKLDDLCISCMECPRLFFCFKCFSSGAEAGSHIRTHQYKLYVKDVNRLSVFIGDKSRWTLLDEINLLRAVEQFGYGNWESIAEFVKDRKLSDCRSHFDRYYLYGTIGQFFKKEMSRKALTVTDHTNPSEASVLLPPVLMSDHDRKLIGFLPLRDDYEREYKNDIERLLNNMSANEDDRDHLKFCKYDILNVYRNVLRERAELKRHAREFGLLSFGLLYLSNGVASAEPKPEQNAVGTPPSRKLSQNSPSLLASGSELKRKKGRPRKSESAVVNESLPIDAFSGDSLAVIQRSFRIMRKGKRHSSGPWGSGADDQDTEKKRIKEEEEQPPVAPIPLSCRTRSARVGAPQPRLSQIINYEGLTDDEKKAFVDNYK